MPAGMIASPQEMDRCCRNGDSVAYGRGNSVFPLLDYLAV